MTNDIFFSWRTSKNNDGSFSYCVTKNEKLQSPINGRYVKTTTAASSGNFKTRARAKSKAIRWVRVLKSQLNN